jgi:hypothetical protein
VAHIDTYPTDTKLAEELDALARQANRIRLRMMHMTLAQAAALAEASPFPGSIADAMIDLDTWAGCAAASLRDTLVIDLAG